MTWHTGYDLSRGEVEIMDLRGFCFKDYCFCFCSHCGVNKVLSRKIKKIKSNNQNFSPDLHDDSRSGSDVV